jgi:hypothetical protein
MTYPGGPGGYPGQGPQQPQPGPGYGGPAAGGPRQLNIPQIAYLVTGGLGVLNLFLAFASLTGGSSSVRGVDIPGTSFYEGGFGWVPGLLLISALTALFSLLPGDYKPGVWPAVFAVGGTIPFLFSVFQAEGSLGTGAVLVLIFGIVQMLAAVGAYLMDAGVIKMPPPGHQQPQYGPPGGYGGPPPGQYPPQPGQYGSPGAQTQYQPQPGQFPPPPGQHPGTPPGGYPQQG